jgi:hypothetical protein
MVGDDRVHVVDVDDLTEISDEDYCPGCGQIGCGAYGSSEDETETEPARELVSA